MTITQRMLSNLSCMFTMYGSHPSTPGRAAAGLIDLNANRCNYDAIEACGGLLHSFPSLDLASSRFDTLPQTYQDALKEQAFQALYRVMTPSKADVALAAKGTRQALTDDCLDALATSNRPDSIPADLRIIQVKSWEPEKRVFIPLPAKKDASLADLVKASTKPDGFMMNVPMRPVGEELGTVDASAWRAGEARSIGVHEPKPLPVYQVPTRELSQGEIAAAAWLADPKREVKPATRSSRMARLQARFWDKGDGHTGVQPVMDQNASLRAMGRINRAIRFNATVAS
jgi:hypothetical protein